MNSESYPPAIAELLYPERLQPLGPGNPNLEAKPRLESLMVESAFAPAQVKRTHPAEACLAGLWLYHDFLEESHKRSQDLASVEGSYWHGMMHRREPDYANAKYWFRRVGRHPVFESLHKAAAELAAQSDLLGQPPAWKALVRAEEWDPCAFIDWCERSKVEEGEAELLCRRMQQREWELLFDHCFRMAVRD
ncbi:MAG: hypothetical protein HY040_24900 [Planctomycetes bacterium]|nr:hypothetical protein [Planctomycetota bacterium]